MLLQRLLDILRARYMLAITALGAALATAAVVSVLIPPRYEASAAIVVDLFSADRIAGAQMSPMAISQYMATQLGILRSPRIARDAAKRIDLAADPALREEFIGRASGETDFEEWLASRLQRALDIRPARESGVIELAVTDRDPKRAAAIANAVAEAYIATTLALRTGPARETTTFFDETARSLGTELQGAQERLAGFQDDRGLVATDERLDSEVARMEQLSAQLTQAQAQSTDARTRAQLARELQARGADRSTLPEIVANTAIQALVSEIARSESRLTTLAERLGPNHPQYQTAAEELTAAKTRLTSEIARVVASIDNAARLAQAREAELRAAVAAQRERVLALRRARGNAQLLARDVERTQKSLDTARERQAITSLESQTRQTNVAILNSATAPRERAFPKLGLNIALAFVLGSLLAVSLALAAEAADRRIYRRDDLRSALDLPVLADFTRAPAGGVGLPAPATRAPGGLLR